MDATCKGLQKKIFSTSPLNGGQEQRQEATGPQIDTNPIEPEDYELYFQILESDECNQLMDGHNLLSADKPIIKRIYYQSSVRLDSNNFEVNCARFHGSQSCGTKLIKPKLIGFKKLSNPPHQDGILKNVSLNRDFCTLDDNNDGNTGGNSGGNTGGNSSCNGHQINLDADGDENCKSGRENTCSTDASGVKFLCVYQDNIYMWKTCASTCP